MEQLLVGKNMIIDRNTICYISERGHKNFFYPSANKVLVKQACEADELNLVSGGTKKAIKILKNNLIPLNEISETLFALNTGNDTYIIVWVEKENNV